MTTTVSLDSNIEDVVSDVDDVKRELQVNVPRSVRRAMNVVADTARAYVRADADYTGDLRRAIHVESEVSDGVHTISVETDSSIAPYATIVEFGSGSRTGETMAGSLEAPPPEEYPPRYPYEAPDIDYDTDNPLNFSGHDDFYALTKSIAEWMRRKPVEPQMDDLMVSAAYIAKTIVDEGNLAHPFMRPAWFKQELRVTQAARNAVRRAVR